MTAKELLENFVNPNFKENCREVGIDKIQDFIEQEAEEMAKAYYKEKKRKYKPYSPYADGVKKEKYFNLLTRLTR